MSALDPLRPLALALPPIQRGDRVAERPDDHGRPPDERRQRRQEAADDEQPSDEDDGAPHIDVRA